MKQTIKKNIQSNVWSGLFEGLCKLPINENKIFFESFLGKSYSDNPKALYEAIVKDQMGENLQLIWSVKNKQFIPGNGKQVKRMHFSYFYHLATAKYIITNSRMPIGFKKRNGQILIQTWHGTPLKTLGYDIKKITNPNTTSEEYLTNFQNDVDNWDYLLSQNAYSTSIFKRAFKYSGRIIEEGYPRNDKLIKYDNYQIESIREKYQINNDDKVLLYAPTYRDYFYDNNQYKSEIKLDFNQVLKRCPEWKIIVRDHYLIEDEGNRFNHERIIVPDENEDINNLMLLSHALLTDYSSVMFDYSNLQRPIIFNAYDLEKYEDKTRGLYQAYLRMIPGKNVLKTDELIKILKNMTNYQRQYSNELKQFCETYCGLDDGNVAQKVIKIIFGGKNE